MVSNLGRWPFSTNYGDLKLQNIHGPLALSGYAGEFTVGVTTTDGKISLSLATREILNKYFPLHKNY